MSNRRKDPWSDYVEHPRFGYAPRLTGLNPHWDPPAVRLHWNCFQVVDWKTLDFRLNNDVVLGTAIVADTTKQKESTVQVTHYFDLKRVCRNCQRPFLFFAEEQKFWYETLQLPLEADAVRCCECRRDERELQRIRARYEELTVRNDLASQELHDQLFSLLTLMEEEVFSRKQCPHARQIINRLETLEGASAKLAASRRRVEQIETGSSGSDKR